MPAIKPGFAVVIFPTLALRQVTQEKRREFIQSALRRAGMLS